MARVRDWNIKYGGSQLYRFKFKLNINKLAFAKSPFYDNMADILEVNVERANGRDDFALTAKDLLPVDWPIGKIAENFRYNGSYITSEVNFERFNKTTYKKAYDAKREYDAQMELAKAGKGKWPERMSPHWRITDEINAEQDKWIKEGLIFLMAQYFVQAVIDKLGEGTLPEYREFSSSEGDFYEVFEGQSLKKVIEIFERLKYIKDAPQAVNKKEKE